jgi:hypothetical protein
MVRVAESSDRFLRARGRIVDEGRYVYRRSRLCTHVFATRGQRLLLFGNLGSLFGSELGHFRCPLGLFGCCLH